MEYPNEGGTVLIFVLKGENWSLGRFYNLYTQWMAELEFWFDSKIKPSSWNPL